MKQNKERTPISKKEIMQITSFVIFFLGGLFIYDISSGIWQAILTVGFAFLIIWWYCYVQGRDKEYAEMMMTKNTLQNRLLGNLYDIDNKRRYYSSRFRTESYREYINDIDKIYDWLCWMYGRIECMDIEQVDKEYKGLKALLDKKEEEAKKIDDKLTDPFAHGNY